MSDGAGIMGSVVPGGVGGALTIAKRRATACHLTRCRWCCGSDACLSRAVRWLTLSFLAGANQFTVVYILIQASASSEKLT